MTTADSGGALRSRRTLHRSTPGALVLGVTLLLGGPLLPGALPGAGADLQAQTPNAQPAEGPIEAVFHDRILSVNPLLLVFLGYVSLDYEQSISDATTLGASLSSFDYSDASYLTLEAKGRYYVGGRALDGLSVGGLLGLVRMSADETDETSLALGIGFMVEHQWLLGVDERLAVTAGGGGTRLFLGSDSDAFSSVVPAVRLSLGWAF